MENLSQLDSLEVSCNIAQLLEDKKAKDIVILDITKVSIFADYFIICSAESSTLVNALIGHVQYELKQHNIYPLSIEDDPSKRWMLIDYGETIVHVMNPELRQYYDLESFWGHAAIIHQDGWKNILKTRIA